MYALLSYIYRFSAAFPEYISILAVSRTVQASPGGQGRLRPMRRIYTQQFISSSPSPMYTGTENRQPVQPLLPTDVPPFHIPFSNRTIRASSAFSFICKMGMSSS